MLSNTGFTGSTGPNLLLNLGPLKHRYLTLADFLDRYCQSLKGTR